MPRMRRRGGAGSGARTSDRGRRHSDRGADDRGGGHRQIRGPFAALSAGSDLWPPGRRTRPPLDAGRLSPGRRLRATARLRAIVRHLEEARTSSSPTRRRAPVLDLADGRPRPANCGPMPVMTEPGAAPIRRARPTSTSPTTSTSVPPRIWPASLDASRSMATAAHKALAEGQRGYAGFLLGARAAKLLRHPGRGPGPDRRRDAGEDPAASTPSNAISRGLGASARLAAAKPARPILEAMKPWLEVKLAAVSGKSKLAEAIRYALSRWAGLTRLDDGRIEIDNNVVERAPYGPSRSGARIICSPARTRSETILGHPRLVDRGGAR